MSPANLTRMLREMACAVTLGAVVVVSAGCGVEVGPDYPVGAYGYYPSDGFIATTEPFYYEGRAAYWYGGRWNYRTGGGWGHYDREPSALYQRRMQGAPGRRTYESHGGGRSAGGGRSGGHR
jgi:hypothetical protein